MNLKEIDQDEIFYFIAGYTSGGASYGATWEEMGVSPSIDLDEKKMYGTNTEVILINME